MTGLLQSPEHSTRRRYRWRWVLLVMTCSLAAGLAGYAGGLSEQGRRFSMVQIDNQALLEEVARLRGLRSQLRLQLAKQESALAVDAQALKDARSTIVSLEARLAEQSSDLGFYRSIMAPSETGKGLQSESLEIVAAGADNTFDYSLVVIQVGNNDRFVSGRVVITVDGQLAGQPASFEWHELSEGVDDSGLKYRFRYFQTMEGRLILPKGFEPETLHLAIMRRNNREPVFEESGRWQQLLVDDESNS